MGNRFVAEEDLTDGYPAFEGAQRLRLRVGALPDRRRFVFVYDWEHKFGEVRLP
jgi:hypothetical protein